MRFGSAGRVRKFLLKFEGYLKGASGHLKNVDFWTFVESALPLDGYRAIAFKSGGKVHCAPKRTYLSRSSVPLVNLRHARLTRIGTVLSEIGVAREAPAISTSSAHPCLSARTTPRSVHSCAIRGRTGAHGRRQATE